jgi:phytol kinase
MNPWLGIALVLALLGGLMAGLRVFKQRCSPHPELVRKLLHVGMGLVTLSFPWLFKAVWPVLLLAGLSTLLLFALRTSPQLPPSQGGGAVHSPSPYEGEGWGGVSFLQAHLGGVVDGVKRESLGEIYFPLSVGALFYFAQGHPIFFCIPMLLLALGDAVAALIGVRYGLLRYTTAEGEKSAEGSLAFFLVAFLSVHVPLLLFTPTGRAESLLIGLILGLLAMLLEAIAWRGLDNLFIPLGGFLLLKTYLAMDVPALLTRLGVTLALVGFVLYWRRRTALNDSAVLGAALYGYLSWSLGGWRWLLAPVLLFVSYPLLWPRLAQDARRSHTIHVVLSVGSAGLFWLFLSLTFRRPELLYLYNLAFAAHLAMIGLARLRYSFPRTAGAWLIVTCVVKGWLLLFVPFVLLDGMKAESLFRALAATLGVALATVAFDRLQPGLRDYPTDALRWRRQAWLAAAGSALGLIPLYLYGW